MAHVRQSLATHDPLAADTGGGLAGTLQAAVRPSFDDAQAALLWADAEIASVFNHPVWWRSAIEAFGSGRELRVLEIRHGDRLVALWPFWVKRLGAKEAFAVILEPVGARVTDYCRPLLRRGYNVADLVQRLIAAAANTLSADTIMLLPKLPDDINAVSRLSLIGQEAGLLALLAARPCPTMQLPDRYVELEQRWTKSHRGDLRRQIKRLETAGRLELWTAQSRIDVAASLSRLYAMHIANWRTRIGFSEFERGPMAGFINQLAIGLPLELIHASELRICGVAIASHFGFRERGSLLWYKPTFDVAWGNYGPGKVQIALAAQAAIAEGLRELDFMQGTESYKLQWTSLTKPTTTYAVARRITYPLWAWNTKIRKLSCEFRF